MTISAAPRLAGPFLGNDLAVSFPFEFQVFTDADIAVYRTSIEGVPELLTRGVHYTVTLNPDQQADPGGAVNYPISGAPLTVGEKLTVIGALPYLQGTDLPPGGQYRAQTVETAVDYQNVLIQQLLELIGRAIRVPPGSVGSTELNGDPAAHIGAFITVSEDGDLVYSDTTEGVFAVLRGGNRFTGAQTVDFQALVEEPVITPNAALSNHFRLELTADRTIANPINLRDGGIYNFWIKQPASNPGKQITWGSMFKWSNGVVPILSSYPGAIDIFVCQYSEADGVLACTHTEEVR